VTLFTNFRQYINDFLNFYRAAKRFIAMALLQRRWIKNRETVASIFLKNVEKHPNKTAFMTVDDKKISFKEVKKF
jgi:hypothetical protein